MPTEMIVDFAVYFPRLGHVAEFVLPTLKRYNDVTSSTIEIGDPDHPLDIYVNAEINASRMPGRFRSKENREGWQGRWIAKCAECSGAEFVDLAHPVFMCCSCFNMVHDYQWLKVRLPAQQQTIEHLLLKRPGKNRNWLPHETVQDLAAENERHGIA